MKDQLLNFYEIAEHTGPFMLTSLPGSWLTLLYVLNGTCRVSLMDSAQYRIHPRHLLLLHTASAAPVEADESLRCCVLSIFPIHEQSPACRTLIERSVTLRLFLERHPMPCELIDSDVENIHIVLRELLAERASAYPLQDEIGETLLSLLLLKLARSWQTHNQLTGIHYIADAKKFIIEHVDVKLDVKMIADHLHIHRSYLQKLFAVYVGHTLVDYINHVRIGKAMLLLASTELRVIDVAVATGFSNRQHFTRVFRKYAHCTPIEYRRSTKNDPQQML